MSRVDGLPDPHPLAGMPAHVDVFEVGPRDGLQNEATVLPTELKAELVRRLVDAGVRAIELTSFVRPDRVPQLADAEALLDMLDLPDDVRTVALVPNLHGLRRAIAHRVSEIAVFASATETFSLRNLNCSIDESFARFHSVIHEARAAGLGVRAYVSMCFGDPWEGPVSLDRVVEVGCRLVEAGCTQLALGDPIGVGTPGRVVALLDAFDRSGLSGGQLAVHFHDTYGQALANVTAALGRGVATVDSSAGGLGGCPFAASATGNLATEDLVWQLDGLGIDTGIDLDRLVATSEWLAGHLGRPSPSRTVQALGRRR